MRWRNFIDVGPRVTVAGSVMVITAIEDLVWRWTWCNQHGVSRRTQVTRSDKGSGQDMWRGQQQCHTRTQILQIESYTSIFASWKKSNMDMGIFWSKFKEIYFPRHSGDLDSSEKTSNKEKRKKIISDNLKDKDTRRKRLNSKRKVRLQLHYSADIL